MVDIRGQPLPVDRDLKAEIPWQQTLGTLGGFGQYALRHLLRDRGIESVTRLYIASIDDEARGLFREASNGRLRHLVERSGTLN